MEKPQITLSFDSTDDAELFLARFLYCGGEQETGFCVVKNKSNWKDNEKLLHLASTLDIKN